MTDTNAHAGGPGLGRIALILAAVVALVAIGLAVWRSAGGNAPPPPSAPAMAGAAPAAGDVSSAIGQLEARLAKNPQDAQGWRMLGWSYYQTERFPDAVNAYRHATAIDPANAEGWSALGEAIALAGKGDMPADATAAFGKALAIDPKDARARYFTAVGKDLAGDHKGAVDAWIALLKDSPPSAPWEQNVRQTIAQVSAKNKIDITGRVPPPSPASLAAAAPPGGSVATDGIPGPTPEQLAAASSLPPGQQESMVRGMVDGLAAKLNANPQDGDGWIRLVRARMVLGQKAEAAQAVADGTAAFAGDKAQQARIADAAKTLGVPGH